jgi:alkane 1-monooxygenase
MGAAARPSQPSSRQSPGTPPAAWADPKRLLWLLGPALPFVALASLVAYAVTGHILFCWPGPLLMHVLIPLADWLVGEDRSNPPEAAVPALEADRYYRFIVALYVPAQFALTIFGAWLAVTQVDSIWALAGLVLTVGAINGVAINTSHELGHKHNAWERWLAKLALAPTFYGHFFVEHNRGHHMNVATPEDPASSRMGESFWRFLPRTVFGSLRSAWRIERARLARRGKGVWSLDNDNLQAWALSVLLFGALLVWLGWAALPFLVLQAVYGFSLLEVVNYLEHYGLLREKDASGRYVRCQPRHSWNSNHVVTNLFLYQLQRHSDHHAHPTRRFQALRHFDEGPQLPSGYASLLMVAYLPPLWFRLMDKRVMAHYGGDLSRVNVHEPARARLQARWGHVKP